MGLELETGGSWTGEYDWLDISTSDTITFSTAAPLTLDFGHSRILTITPLATSPLTSGVGAVSGAIMATMSLTQAQRASRTAWPTGCAIALAQ
jgi:hypothetical protein